MSFGLSTFIFQLKQHLASIFLEVKKFPPLSKYLCGTAALLTPLQMQV